jgi:hypothetical protein
MESQKLKPRIIYPSDLETIEGVCYKTALKRMKAIRTFFEKEKRSIVTREEVAEYFAVTPEYIEASLNGTKLPDEILSK